MNKREHEQERKRVQRQNWKEKGRCVSCGNARDTHRLKCTKCYTSSLASEKRIRIERKSKGICTECGIEPALVNYSVGEKCLEKQRISHNKHRIARLANSKEWRKRLTQKVFAAYGNKCKCCGETEPLFLEIDHVQGNGTQHRKTVRGGVTFYRWLQKNNYPQDDFQLLCRNCNYGRYRNGGICPHQVCKSEK